MDIVFWGRFDPPTIAHISIIECCIRKFSHLHLVIIDDKNKKSPVTNIRRSEWIQQCLSKFNQSKITIYLQDEISKIDYFTLSKDNRGKKLGIICGGDAFELWALNNKNTLDYYHIFLLKRNEKMMMPLPENVSYLEFSDEYTNISSGTIKSAIISSDNSKISKQLPSHLIGKIESFYSPKYGA